MTTLRDRILLPILLTLLLAGCPRRLDFGPHGQLHDPEQLLKLTNLEEGQVFSVQGESKIRVDSPQGKGVVTLFVAVTYPSLIHLESLNFFGKPSAVLVSDGSSFGFFQAEEGRFYRGPATPQNISRFFPVLLSPEELTALMLGRAPRIPAESARLSFDEKEASYLVTLRRGQIEQKLWIHPVHHRVVKSEVSGVNAYNLRFENIEQVKGVTYPRRVVLSAPSAQTELELSYKDVEVNQPPDLTMFETSPPANVPVIEVDEKGNPKPTPQGATP